MADDIKETATELGKVVAEAFEKAVKKEKQFKQQIVTDSKETVEISRRAYAQFQKQKLLYNTEELEKAKANIKKEYEARAEALAHEAVKQDPTKKYSEELKAFKALLKDKEKAEEKAATDKSKKDKEKAKKIVNASNKKDQLDEADDLLSSKNTFDKISGLKKLFERQTLTDENGNPIKDAQGNDVKESGLTALSKGLSHMTDKIVSGLSDIAKDMERGIDEIASFKSSIDTRLQGSKNATKEGSYWDQMTSSMSGYAAITPYFKRSDLTNKVSELVGKGISFDVEQRAFLMTISSKVATTFETTSTSLNKLVRIQQQDSTAARLGMESALTSFLNNMYETTEYMSDIMNNINSSLYEAEALMSTTEATAFEYQVNKWLGSMYSVGMSDSSVQGIGSALSKLAAGQLEGITDSSTGNLLVMAANEAGISISDILTNGLTDETTNELMEAMVDYLSKIYEQAGDSKVIQQQVASIYGLTASDLKAMLNLTTDTATMSTLSNSSLSYADAITQLTAMVNTMGDRTSIGEKISNITENLKYTIEAGIAGNSALYATYKIANILDATTGGISIPDIMTLGSGASLNTTVADILRVATMGGSLLDAMSSAISSGGGGGISGGAMLKALGISGNNIQTVSRGTGTGLITTSGETTSTSSATYSNSGGAYDYAMQNANQQKADAVSGEEEEIDIETIDKDIKNISDLLQAVIDGTSKFHVVMGYENPEIL